MTHAIPGQQDHNIVLSIVSSFVCAIFGGTVGGTAETGQGKESKNKANKTHQWFRVGSPGEDLHPGQQWKKSGFTQAL